MKSSISIILSLIIALTLSGCHSEKNEASLGDSNLQQDAQSDSFESYPNANDETVSEK